MLIWSRCVIRCSIHVKVTLIPWKKSIQLHHLRYVDITWLFPWGSCLLHWLQVELVGCPVSVISTLTLRGHGHTKQSKLGAKSALIPCGFKSIQITLVFERGFRGNSKQSRLGAKSTFIPCGFKAIKKSLICQRGFYGGKLIELISTLPRGGFRVDKSNPPNPPS